MEHTTTQNVFNLCVFLATCSLSLSNKTIQQATLHIDQSSKMKGKRVIEESCVNCLKLAEHWRLATICIILKFSVLLCFSPKQK